jgi:thiazole/oxazole-forming peptide maturase SagD family component
MPLTPSFVFLNENDGNLPFRKALSEAIFLCELPVLVFVALNQADLGKLPKPVNAPALMVLAVKNFVAVSSLFEPGKSVCFSCLSYWLLTSGAILELSSLPPGHREAQFAMEAIRDAVSMRGEPADHFRNVMRAFQVEHEKRSLHPVYPLRNCPQCRAMDVPEGWGLRVHCSSLTGIVRKMQITSSRAAGAYRAIGEWASPLPIADARPVLKPQESHGRGRTRDEAEQGCIGEALERYSLIYRGDELLQRGRLRDVAGVDPRHILLYSDCQYESREQWNRSADERYFVGERFDPDREIDWVPGFDLENGSPKLLPAACVLMWYSFPAGEQEYARADTIGCGSGRTLDDALAHALLEWIERDAMAIWWYNRIQRPAVNLESFAMQELLDIRDDLDRIGRNLWLLDCTTDFAVPTYVSVAPRKDGTEVLFAGASHPSPRVAAWKAASEVGQLWFSAVHANAVDIALKDWLAESLYGQPYIVPTHEIEAPAEPSLLNSRETVVAIVDRLQGQGLHAYAADLSRADVLLKTVRAVVPGLRHIWNRRAPGRLYDVPVRLGWRDAQLKEEQLNPYCCMI